MRTMTAIRAAALAALLLHLACAHERPAIVSGDTVLDSLAVDSTGAAVLDGLFVEKHGAVMKELSAREAAGPFDPFLIEVRALVAAAEEMYLEGKTAVAIKLLDDASALMRRGP